MQPKNDEEEKQKDEGSKNIQKGQQVIGWLVEGVQQGGNQGTQQKASPQHGLSLIHISLDGR